MAAFMASMNTSGIDGGPGGAGYAFAKQVVAHYVNDLALQLAPELIRVNAIHPTNVNTDMLHSPPMYRAFRPDLQNPTREEAELVFPLMQAMPIPYVEPEDISEAVLFLRQRCRPVRHRAAAAGRRGRLPQESKPWSGV